MTEAFATFHAAAVAGAAEVAERPNGRGFLESELERAIARHLPGSAALAQSKRRLTLPGFEPYPYGVDIDWRHAGVHAGVEVKVWDAIDSLFDLIKLATAVHHGVFDEGYCAVAGEARHWAAARPFTALAQASSGGWHTWPVAALLNDSSAARDAILVKSGPRPVKVPAAVETTALAPIAMPKARTHTLRLLAVRPATGTGPLELPRAAS